MNLSHKNLVVLFETMSRERERKNCIFYKAKRWVIEVVKFIKIRTSGYLAKHWYWDLVPLFRGDNVIVKGN